MVVKRIYPLGRSITSTDKRLAKRFFALKKRKPLEIKKSLTETLDELLSAFLEKNEG